MSNLFHQEEMLRRMYAQAQYTGQGAGSGTAFGGGRREGKSAAVKHGHDLAATVYKMLMAGQSREQIVQAARTTVAQMAGKDVNVPRQLAVGFQQWQREHGL